MITADSQAYRQLWRIADGAVRDAFGKHPDYLTRKGHYSARRSIVKRVTGAVLAYATEVARSRSIVRVAADTAVSELPSDVGSPGAANAKGRREGFQGSSRDASAILHAEIQLRLDQPQGRDPKTGRWLKKPTAQSIIIDELRAEYGPRSAAVLLDAQPLPVQQHLEPEETAADFFFTPMMILHLVLGAACIATSAFHPIINDAARIMFACLGAYCFWLSARCLP